ncbi:PP0621 family protein [Eleftheria terrae]|uniref:PP0621 family protein n=1 Tax=Eleftheria terrae TaxID=1597781 RepID=UPI00263A3F1D|nr:PP0621 family protein [Eleftheria terrae]WKB52015.1 PP0621 family protein [Eleftheria terrae]
MKYLVLILVIVLVLGFMRAQRPARPDSDKRRPAGPAPSLPREMVACRHCGVHLPRDEALPGPGGPYCSEAHRRAAQD